METKTNRYKTLAKDTVLFAISSFGSKILLFLLTPLYTSVLLTEEYGIADILVTTIDFIYPILTLAISEAALRFAMQKDVDKKSVFTTSMTFVVFSSVLVLVLWPFVGRLNKVINEYYAFFVCIYFLNNSHSVFANFLKGIDKTKIFAIQGILQTVTVIASNILLLVGVEWGLKGYLMSIVLGYVVSNGFMFGAARLYKFWDTRAYNKTAIKEMLKYSIPMIPTILAWTINTSIDKYMITGIVGIGANGIYSVAHKIPSLVTTVFLVFIQAWQISAITAHGADDESDFYTSTYSVLNIACVGCVAVILPLTKNVSSILFAKDFYLAWKLVPYLCLSAVFSSLAGFLASGFRAAKKTMDLFVSVAVGAVVNVVLNFVLISNIGTIGAALATAISFFVVWLIRMITIQKIVHLKVPHIRICISYLLLFYLCYAYSYELSGFLLRYVIAVVLLLILNAKEIMGAVKRTCIIISKVRKKN